MSFVVVDYSKGNLRSVQKGLQLAGADARISESAADIRAAQAIVLPGVGSFADASAQMLASGQMQAIRERVAAGVPFLGICLGLQLLFERGDEGAPAGTWVEGLGLLKGACRRIDAIDAKGNTVKVPHVGWNQVRFCAGAAPGNGADGAARGASSPLSALFEGIEDGSNFYFTHSYQCEPAHASDVLATVVHATEFPCVVRKEHMFGIQFHPEKSSHKGLAVLKNFVAFVLNS
jgi:glutamine amidotransferase